MNRLIHGLCAVLLLVAYGCDRDVTASHKSLVWDSNKESDMKEYRVYKCAASPCLASGVPLATIAHSNTSPTHRLPIADSDEFYVVYAVDTALNVSAPSATVGANLQAPVAPVGLRIE